MHKNPNSNIRESGSSRNAFQKIYSGALPVVLASLLMAAFACGGEDDEETPETATDAGQEVVADASETGDSGIIENNDAGIVEEDAGNDNDAGIVEEDAGDSGIEDTDSGIPGDCPPGFTGDSCDECLPGYYGEECKKCECNKYNICHDGIGNDGSCECVTGYTGTKCGECVDGYHWEEIIEKCVPDGYVGIPAGQFTWTHHTRQHAVGDIVSLDTFNLKKTPVTLGEFKACVAAGACKAENYQNLTNYICNATRDTGDGTYDNHPMNCLKWYGAKEYCEWVGGRLPAEDEWEYAATHNGTEHLVTAYPWGDDEPDETRANFKNKVGATTAVGKYSPAGDSPLGLVDMAGNVYEWTSTLPYNSTADHPPYQRKGGAFYSGADQIVISGGDALAADSSEYSAGVRCVK